MKKMNMLVALFVVLLCSSFTLGKGKGKNKDVYMAGVSASFSDSLIFFTDIQLVDSVELDKDKLLPERQQYSTQLKRFLEGQGMKNRTCFIYFNTNRKKLEKAIRKMKEEYQEGGRNILRQVDADFKFKKAIIYNPDAEE
jgi:hypothetical protein